MLREGTYLVITPFFPSKESHHGAYIYDQINEIRNQTNFNIKVIKTVSLSSLEVDYKYDGFQVFVLRNINIPLFIFPVNLPQPSGLQTINPICWSSKSGINSCS